MQINPGISRRDGSRLGYGPQHYLTASVLSLPIPSVEDEPGMPQKTGLDECIPVEICSPIAPISLPFLYGTACCKSKKSQICEMEYLKTTYEIRGRCFA